VMEFADEPSLAPSPEPVLCGVFGRSINRPNPPEETG
jgi:hypothetical protein